MAANVVNRETIRDAFAALLTTKLVDGGTKYVARVYEYQATTFNKEQPIVVVSSDTSERERRTINERYKTFFTLNVDVFVIYVETSWTEKEAEDRLDRIEKEIADVVMDDFSNDDWQYLEYDGPTDTGRVIIGGEEYRRERIKIRVWVTDG